MHITPQEAVTHVQTCIRAGLVPMLTGSPGIGKSDIIKQVFKTYKLKLIDIRLTQYDPTEFNGLFKVTDDRASHIPFDTFPLKSEPIPDNYDGWGIFYDEFNSGSLAVQAAAYKVILDRMIGQHPLHKNVIQVCAGNNASDNAIVNRMSTAMQSRLVHLELTIDVEQWVQWANKAGLDHRVIAYIQSTPGNLHKFNPDHDDVTFACPRTWEFVAKLITRTPGSLQPLQPLLAGTISDAISAEFIMYSDIYTDLPTIAAIMADPTGIKIKQDPGILYALSNMVAAYIKPNNADILMKFIDQLPIEFATITLQNSLHRNIKLGAHPSILKWIEVKAPGLFS